MRTCTYAIDVCIILFLAGACLEWKLQGACQRLVLPCMEQQHRVAHHRHGISRGHARQCMKLVQEDFEFEDGPPQTLTAEDISEVMREEIVTILAEVTGELLASPIDGCTGELLANASAGNNFAACEVVAVADDIRTEIDAIAELGIASPIVMHLL